MVFFKKLLKTHIFKFILIVCFAIGIFLGSGVSFFLEFPELDRLKNYQPNTTTRIFDSNGKLIAELYLERREPTPLSKIPIQLRQAFLSIEDARFYEHPGVSYPDIIRAFFVNLRSGRFVQGGSTITQQLAKVLFLTPERTLKRKIKEALLAIEIEKRFTKDEILEFYLNQIYLGSGSFGVQAASKIYFGKNLSELTLAECAILAGLPKAPSKFNPRRHPKKSIKRRNLVLNRMLAERFIKKREKESAEDEFIRLNPFTMNQTPESAYFVEHVRKQLSKRYGSSIYRSGLQVHTTLDLSLQKDVHAALRKGIKILNKRRGFNDASKKMKRYPKLGDRFQFRITEVKSKKILGIIGNFEANMNIPTNINYKLLNVGDIVLGKVKKLNKNLKKIFLGWEESIQGAVIAFDPHTGAVKAMTGGTNFRRFKFNRVVQAKRQPGSAFKPIIYGGALSMGYGPNHILMDSPFVEHIPGTKREWKPTNYSNKFYGPVTMRNALEKSLNLATIKLLTQIKPKKAIKFARRLGIHSKMYPYLSLALGSIEVTPYEFVSAYIPFATNGIYARPYEIEKIADDGNRIIEKFIPQFNLAISPETAFQMKLLLRGVVTDGTAKLAKKIKLFIAGKTGTTNSYRDAWFVGFSPDLVLGVWVGKDSNKKMGFRASGGTAALPIWVEIMEKWVKRTGSKFKFPNAPPKIKLLRIDSKTGFLPSKNCRGKIILEAFVEGSEPTESCL
ncbi:MAG: PBP1A family penicillin-binding protein [Nitrospinota bacterium]|nr:PBP1A family penicillin-binding protein [Nitrospinota bacterium]